MKNDPDEDGTHIRVMPSPKARLNETSLLFRAVFLLVLGNAVWFLWAHRFVPTADFPEREYQGMILSRFIRGVPPEAYSIQLYPVPHSLTAVLGALFDLILSPELSGKVILTIAVIAFAMASTYLLKSLGASERHPLMFVPLAFIFDSKFFWGEIDYYLGFAAFCAFAGFMLSRRNEPARIRGWLVFLVLCLVFEIHLVPYICCGLVCVAIAATRRDRGSLRKLLLPVIASGFLLVWYATERMASRLPADATFWKPWTADSLVRNFIGRFSIFHIFCPWYDYDSPLFKAAALANIAVLLSVMSLWFFCVLRWRLSRRDDKDVVVAVAFMLIGYLSADMVTGADLGERFLFPATWMAIAWFAPRWNPRLPRARLVTTILVALIFAQLIYIDRYLGFVSMRLADTYVELAAAQTHEEFCALYRADFAASWGQNRHKGMWRFLPNHPTALRLPYYLAMERGQDAPLTLSGGIVINARPNGTYRLWDFQCGPTPNSWPPFPSSVFLPMHSNDASMDWPDSYPVSRPNLISLEKRRSELNVPIAVGNLTCANGWETPITCR